MTRAVLLVFFLSAACTDSRHCIDGGLTCWASHDEIVAVAAKCGVPNFEPTKAGAAWAAYVPETVPAHVAKEDCIYKTFARQGLLVTR